MFDCTLYLVAETPSGTVDAFLPPVTTETRTEVLAISVPVTRSEFYKAGELGIQPEFEFIIHPAEYSGEREIEYNGNRLRIYRTYERNPDELEIYCNYAEGQNQRPDPTPTGGGTT